MNAIINLPVFESMQRMTRAVQPGRQKRIHRHVKRWIQCVACGGLLAVGQWAQAQSDNTVLILNRLRAPGGACAAAAAPPVVSQGALDTAASRLALGASLEAALKFAGYRMSEARVITLSGPGLRAQLEALLASRFCDPIGIPKFTDAGVYERGNQMWIVLASPFAPKVDLTREQVAQRMLALVNQARAEPRHCGNRPMGAAPPVKWNKVLETAAARQAADMADNNYFSHTGRDGSTPAQRVTRAGYRYRTTGENIAAGALTAEETVAGWIKSPGHCANLMNRAYTEMGVAFSVNATSSMGVYWVQHLGTPR